MVFDFIFYCVTTHTLYTRLFVCFSISVMAESENKSREAKLDFEEDVLAGNRGKLEIHNFTRNEILIGVKLSNILRQTNWF